MRGFGFHEVMEGEMRRDGAQHPFRFDLDVEGPPMRPFGDWTGVGKGMVVIPGFVDSSPAQGTIEVSPARKKRVTYSLDFTGPAGERLRFDGHKTIRMLVGGWTLLRGGIYDADGNQIARAVLRFVVRRQFLPFVSSFRFRVTGSRTAQG